MPDSYHEGDHKQPAPEKQAARVELKSDHKAVAEASHGMEDRNKAIVAEVLKKRHERKSGGTDQLNKDDHKGKRVASADELLPLEKPNKPPLSHHITESPGQHPKLEALHKPDAGAGQVTPNIERAKEAASKALQGVIGGGLYEGSSIPKKIAEPFAPEKIRVVPAGTPLEIRGHVYPLNELTAQGRDRASDAREKNQGTQAEHSLKGVPTIVGKDGIRRVDGHFLSEVKTAAPEQKPLVQMPDIPDVIHTIGKIIDPVANVVSHFNSDSTKALHNLLEQGKEAVGLNPSHADKPIHKATGDGSTLPKPVQNPGDAAHLAVGAVTGFTKTVNDMMPGLTPKGAIDGATQAAKQAAALAQGHIEHETNMHANPIGTVLQDAVTAVRMYSSAVDWANRRSQTETFAERGQDIGKASPDVMMASEIIFIARSGHLVTPRDAVKLQLESKTPEELEKLGIQHTMADKLKPEDIVNPIDRNASPQEKVRQLEGLSVENQPLIDDFKKQIDSKYGSFSYGEPKAPQDILDKIERPETRERKPWFGVEHIRDSQRFTTVVDNLDALPAIAKDLKESGFQVINPDINKMLPNQRGWRMMAFDLRAPNGQLVEFQVLPKEMYKAGQETHPIHERWRDADVRKLSYSEHLQMEKEFAEAQQICLKEWSGYLKRTGQSEQHISNVMDKVDKLFRKDKP